MRRPSASKVIVRSRSVSVPSRGRSPRSSTSPTCRRGGVDRRVRLPPVLELRVLDPCVLDPSVPEEVAEVVPAVLCSSSGSRRTAPPTAPRRGARRRPRRPRPTASGVEETARARVEAKGGPRVLRGRDRRHARVSASTERTLVASPVTVCSPSSSWSRTTVSVRVGAAAPRPAGGPARGEGGAGAVGGVLAMPCWRRRSSASGVLAPGAARRLPRGAHEERLGGVVAARSSKGCAR